MAPVVLIAASRAEARAWLDRQPAPPVDVIVVTPHSPDAARGRTAAAIFATPAATAAPSYARLVEVSAPAVVAYRAQTA